MALIALDFDQTLFYFDENGTVQIYDGAREAAEKLKEAGHEIVIYTCRIGIAMDQGTLKQEVAGIEATLRDFNVPYDSIWIGPKMVADCYIDDRAISFQGDWKATLKQTESFLESRASGSENKIS